MGRNKNKNASRRKRTKQRRHHQRHNMMSHGMTAAAESEHLDTSQDSFLIQLGIARSVSFLQINSADDHELTHAANELSDPYSPALPYKRYSGPTPMHHGGGEIG